MSTYYTLSRYIYLLIATGLFGLYFCHKENATYSTVPKNVKDTLKVMTYNIHHANPPTKEKIGTIDVEAVAKVINEQQPDLVALQEIDVNTARSGKELNEAKKLGQLTDMHHYFAKTLNYKGGKYGIAVLSRFPIQDSSRYELPTHKDKNEEVRALCLIKLKIANHKNLYFGSTHLSLYKSTRLLQAKKLSQIAQSLSEPLIIGGDFNSTPKSQIISSLDSTLTRSCKKGCPTTIPWDQPKRKIDYIMYYPRDKFRVSNEKAINYVHASDHLPLIANIYFISDSTNH